MAAALSVVPGLGQLYNLQPAKAAFFLLATVLTIGPAVLLITAGERLGSTLLHRGDGAAFLLLALGSVIVFLALFLLGLAFWASAVVDARRSAIEITEQRLSGGRWWFFRL
jgi:TM2 domain-containing membrane protein YozV